MKFYDSIGPNPHVVRMVMAEKGISLPSETIDIRAGANRSGDYIKKVPAGGTPALELDDGRIISEITVIAEYLEELHPAPALVGTTAEKRAETRNGCGSLIWAMSSRWPTAFAPRRAGRCSTGAFPWRRKAPARN